MLQGDLEVSSEVGKGSIFRLVLPESSDASAPVVARRPSPSDVAHAAS
jgi:hypothetical protein